MKLDHMAYRVKNRKQYAERLIDTLGYWIQDEFVLEFDDGSIARCYLMQSMDNVDLFISEGVKGSTVWNWVFDNGPGLHHVAYAVDDVVDTMIEWGRKGIQFLSGPIYCPCERKLVQVFTEKKSFGHIVELIERNGHPGFCEHNVKKLMDSTK